MEECEEAPCSTGELALAAVLSFGDLNMGEMDEWAVEAVDTLRKRDGDTTLTVDIWGRRWGWCGFHRWDKASLLLSSAFWSTVAACSRGDGGGA
jgi:hypothetical protein